MENKEMFFRGKALINNSILLGSIGAEKVPSIIRYGYFEKKSIVRELYRIT
jgi:hypothetical protein